MTMGVVRVMCFSMAMFCAFVFGMRFGVGQVPAQVPAAVPTTTGATVVDVARGVDPGTLARIVQIGQDERIVAIDDQPVANDVAAGAEIGRRSLGASTYLDLTVGSVRGKRRVLVLMH